MVTDSKLPDALRRYSVATRREWIAAGISPRRLRTLIQAGELVQVRFGAYATARAIAEAGTSAGYAHALQVAAAIVRTDRRSYVTSHESAATIHGISLLNPPREGLVTLTRKPDPAGGRVRTNPTLSIRAAQLPDAHIMTVYGIRVTTPDRTVMDLARVLPFMDAVVAADSAIHQLKSSQAKMRKVLRECRRWPGAMSAERVIEFSNGLSESVLESCARVRFHEAGLPAPRLQERFSDGDGGVLARADFFWPEHKTVVEADGMLKYNDPANPRAMRDQFRRDRLLRERGYKVVHFTWHELFTELDRVIARIREAFAAPSPW